MNKRLFFPILITTVALMASCQREMEWSNTPEIRATVEDQPETKTSLSVDESGAGTIYWNPADKIDVFFGTTRATYTSQNSSNAKTATFKTSDSIGSSELSSTNIWGLYPSNSSSNCNGNSVTTTLPSTQYGVPNTFDDDLFLAVAHSTSTSLQFYNVCGGIKFSLTSDDITSIILRGNNNENIAGKIQLSFSNGVPKATVIDGVKEITLKPKTGGTFAKGVDYYIILLPCTLSAGFTMTFTYKYYNPYGGGRFSFLRYTDSSVAIKRSVISKKSSINLYAASGCALIHRDGYTKGAPRYYRTEAEDVEIYDETDYNEGSGITVRNSLNPATPVLVLDELESIDLLNYVETYANGLEDLISTAGIQPIYKFAFAGFDEDNNLVVNLSNPTDPTKAPYLSDDDEKTNQNDFVILDGSEVTINPIYAKDKTARPALGRTPLIYVRSFYKGDVLAEGFIKLEIRETSSYQASYFDIRTQGLTIQLSNQHGIYSVPLLNAVTITDDGRNQILSNGIWLTGNGQNGIPDGVTATDYYNIYYNIEFDTYSLPSDLRELVTLELDNNDQLAFVFDYSKTDKTFTGTYTVPFLIRFNTDLGSYNAMFDLVIKGVTPEAVDLGLSVKWASFNLGAAAPEEYGDYYAWGETEPYYSSLDPLVWKEGKSAGYDWPSYQWCNGSETTLIRYCPIDKPNYWGGSGTPDGKTEFKDYNYVDDAARQCLGGKWRVQTDAEWAELLSNCTWTWTTQNGVYGYMVTSNKTGYTDKSIFLPAAGLREGTSLDYVGSYSYGFYWSSSLNTGYPNNAWSLQLYSSGVDRYDFFPRYFGFSVRPVSE